MRVHAVFHLHNNSILLMKLQHWANGKLVVDIAFYSSKRTWCVLIRACQLIMLNMEVNVQIKRCTSFLSILYLLVSSPDNLLEVLETTTIAF